MLKFYSFCMSAALLVSIWGCGENTTRPSCEIGSCGPHGSCQSGACICDPGYQPGEDGLDCQPFPYDQCQGITCSDLGYCEVAPEGPYGLEIPVCRCQPGMVQSPDLRDCLDLCATAACEPGSCEVDSEGMPSCVCPSGFEVLADPPACHEKTEFAWDLVYLSDGEQWKFGRAWLDLRHTAQGLQVNATSNFSIQVSYNGAVGGTFRTAAWFDENGQLLEFVQDQQSVFGRTSARRKLHFVVDDSGDVPVMRFESNILDSIWHGQYPLSEGRVPIPMADGYEYPTFSYGCFDPFFYFALGQAVDPAAGSEQTQTILIPSFVLPSSIKLLVSEEDGSTRIQLDGWGVEASFENGILHNVDYGWVAWQEVPYSAPLETNLRPLPTTPSEHLIDTLPPFQEEQVSFSSSDGTRLAGSLTQPDPMDPDTVVLMLPGLFPESRDKGRYHSRVYRDLAARLAGSGYSSLRFDDRGVGESEGQTNALPSLLADDVNSAFNWLLQEQGFQRVVILGHGFACPRAMAAAARLPTAGLILLATTGEDLVDDWYHRMETVVMEAFSDRALADAYRQDLDQTTAGLRQGTFTEDYHQRSAAFWHHWLNRDLLDVSAIAGPVLIMHGENDLSLPVAHMAQVQQAFTQTGQAQVEIKLLLGLSNSLSAGAIENLWEEFHLPQTVAPGVGLAISEWLGAHISVE